LSEDDESAMMPATPLEAAFKYRSVGRRSSRAGSRPPGCAQAQVICQISTAIGRIAFPTDAISLNAAV
jgi:hypothetical protein